MNYLIFEYKYEGHYLEYYKFLLSYIIKENCINHYYFVISHLFNNDVITGYLPTTPNIHYHFLTEEEVNRLNKKGKYTIVTNSYYRCKTLSKYIKKFKINNTVLLNSIDYIFGISLFIPKYSSISTIEYIIPRHRPNNTSYLKKIKDKFRFWLYAKTPQLENLFLLNDEESADIYNRTYHCSKFKFLPDPIEKIPTKFNDKFKKDNKIILLHAGRFRKEKGTFDIFEALKSLTADERALFKFILCGGSEVEEDNIRANMEIQQLNNLMDVEFYPGFVEEEFLHQLYFRADYILIPYHNYFQSSGNLGHAASYGKPVIGPKQGLLGNLIREYNLGYTLENLNSDSIIKVLRHILALRNPVNWNFEDYVKRCNPEDFARRLLD